jgi:DnaJ-class molecular chaperone
MGDSEETTYTFVRGYIRRIRAMKPKTFEVEHAYCGGRGIVPGSDILIRQPDKSCKGTGFIILQGKPEEYKPDKFCDGTGRNPNNVLTAEPCPNCHGVGLIKVK